MVAKKIYVQGGIGAVPNGERFGEDYDLPNATAYNETCAAIGNVYWNHRMFLLHGDSKYADVMEKVLYNGLISGVGLDGKSFFYTNALQVTKGFTHKDLEAGRSGWFECSCCPTNIARFLPSLPGYMYAKRDQDTYINLYISGTADLQIAGRPVKIEQQNDYPWNGLLTFHVIPQAEQQFTLRFRLPGWTKNEAIPSDLYSFKKASNKPVVIKVNGQPVKYQTEAGYALISRTWKPNDLVQMDLHMEVRQVVASRNLKDNIGKSALQRGPLVYCAEWKDNGGRVSNLQLPANAVFKAQFEPDLLGGVNVLKGKAFTAIPYYGWANRGEGEMTVWFPSAAGTKKISK